MMYMGPLGQETRVASAALKKSFRDQRPGQRGNKYSRRFKNPSSRVGREIRFRPLLSFSTNDKIFRMLMIVFVLWRPEQ